MAVRVSAGRLREYVTIKRKQATNLPDGSQSVTYIDVLQTYCSMKMQNADIDVIAAQDNISQVFVFTMRYRTDIPFIKGDRLFWRDRDLKIHSFNWDILRTRLDIICKADNETTSNGDTPS